MEAWRSTNALTWKQHKGIQAEALLVGLEERQPMEQARLLLARCGSCYSEMMNYPEMRFLRLERGNELGRHLAYFVLAIDELIPSFRWPSQEAPKQTRLHRIVWPQAGFVKIGNYSATSIETAVTNMLCHCWLAVRKATANITDDTRFTTKQAAAIHKTLCAELTKWQLPTDPAGAAALAQEIHVRLSLVKDDRHAELMRRAIELYNEGSTWPDIADALYGSRDYNTHKNLKGRVNAFIEANDLPELAKRRSGRRIKRELD